MCGRVRQSRYAEFYGEYVFKRRHFEPMEPGLQENIPPGTSPIVLHRLNAGTPAIDRLHWGYHPAWSKRGPVSNARLDKLFGGAPFWRALRAHRIILPGA